MSLARKAVRGAALTIGTGIGSRAIGLVGTLVLTRFLAPVEYGEAGVAFVLVVTANQLATLGLGQYVIAHREAGRDVAFHGTLFTLTLGLLAIGAIVLARQGLAPYLGAPTMARFVPGLGLAIFIDRIGYMPERILVRDMRFREIGIARTGGELAYSAVSVWLAARGWGAMSIVYGNIARSVLRSAILIATTPRREWLEPHAFSFDTTRKLVAFGLPLSVGANCSFAARRLDNLLVSGFFGAGVLGIYNLAYNLADIPAVQVGEQIGDVLLPSFAHLPAERRTEALIRSTMLLGLIMFPLAIGLGAVAPTAVAAFFDRRWAEVAPMLVLLSALSVTRPIGWTISSYLQARQRPRLVMALEIFKVVALLGTIAVIGRLSPYWTCGAVGMAFGAHALLSLVTVHRLDRVPLGHFLRKLLPPLLACGPMVGSVLLLRAGYLALGLRSATLRLVLEMLVGAAVYAGTAWLCAREATRELLRLLGGALRPTVDASSTPRPQPEVPGITG